MGKWAVALAGLIVWVVGCGGGDDGGASAASKCTAGQSVACVGPGGCKGGQVCQADGTYGVCDCGGPDASIDGGSDGALDSGSDSSPADAAQEMASDAPPSEGSVDGDADGGPVSCDLVTQAPCGAAERCTSVDLGNGSSDFRCMPDGTVGANGACTVGAPGETTGFDDCKRGLTCVGDRCLTICDTVSSPSCGTEFTCAAMASLNPGGGPSTVGACIPGCDPLTQRRLTDDAPACGSPDPSNPTLGCYLTPGGAAICALAGDVANTSDVPLTGTVYMNSCAPGYVPLLRRSSSDSTPICVAYCKPGPTDSAQPANAAGLVGSGYTCPDKGAGGTHECRYWHMIEDQSAGATQWSDTLGFCFDYMQYRYDSDGDSTLDMQDPSCTAISPTADTDGDGVLDVSLWGCTP